MSRRTPCRQIMGTSSSPEAPDVHLGSSTGEEGLRDSSLGFSEGEPMMTDACEQSRLSMVVVEPAELGVEQAQTGGTGNLSGRQE
jgi:hypothetical protein